ncbi:hypothetical protein ACQPYH_38995 [Kribbella sp. CA-245084]|uniref:hypothetical protein n=1 Tax=Kribbella sp. CA-245084 TaxID=3239940 RepID=UPI003D8E1C25
MTADVAARWAGTVVPSWIYRWLMPAGWVAAIVVSVASDTGRCSVEDPTVCGPDRTFSLALIVCFASLVLSWWQPILAAAAGVLFLTIELRYDDVAGARTAWTVYGAACTALLVWLVVSRRRQRSMVAGVPRQQVQVPAATRIGVTIRLLVAGALVLVGVGALSLMRWQDQREETHLRRAVEQTAVVKSQTDDGDLVLELPDGRHHTVTMLDDYAIGASIPVFVDPADSGWLRPRAELADYTYWYTVAGGAWVLAVLLVLRDVRVRRARPRRSWTGQGLPVRIEPDSTGAFAVRSADGAILLGFLDTELDDDEGDARLFDAFDALDEEENDAPAKLKREWEETLRRYRGEALLLGDLAEGSWPSLLLGEQVLRPVGPFRAPRRMPWGNEPVAGLPQDRVRREVPSVPFEPAQELPTLPWEVPLQPRPWWDRPGLVAVLVLGPVAIGAFAVSGEWFPAIAGTLIAGQLVHFVGVRTFYRVTATATELWIRSGWFERRVPWRSVESVEVDEDRLNLESGDDWHVVGGIAEKETARAAAVFETLRLRSRTGLPAEAVGRRVAPCLVIDVAFLTVCALILVLARFSPF